MKTKYEIIDEISRDPFYKEVLNNIVHYHPNKEDLLQDVYIILLEKDEELIQDLYYNNKLVSYYSRIIKLNFKSSTSRFHYKYRKNQQTEGLEFDEEIYEDDINDFTFEFDIYEYSKQILDWYEDLIFNLYYRFKPIPPFSDDIEDKITYEKIAEILETNMFSVYTKMMVIKNKLYKFILNDKEVADNIPEENKIELQKFIEKTNKYLK